jgi:hypothetical protein
VRPARPQNPERFDVLVIVSTSAATVADDRREHRRSVDDITEHLIVAPMGGRRGPLD